MSWSFKDKLWYHSGHTLSTGLTYLFLRPKIVNRHNLPKKGRVIIAPNHRTMLDVPCLGCATFRPLRFMIKSDLFKSKFIKWYFETNGSFSVDRNISDSKAVKKAISVLNADDALVVFPEGKRNKEELIGELAAGVGFLAVKSSSPIIPVGIANLDKAIKRKILFIPIFTRAHIVIGEPITCHIGKEGKTSVVANELMEEVKIQLERLYIQAQALDV